MKRSAPLTRRTGLKRSSTLKRSQMRRKPPPPGFSEETKAAVRRRSGNVCELSGCSERAVHFHHRKLRRFGDHRDVNCLHLCLWHHEAIHANPGKSYLLGWLVRSTLDPAVVPVKRADARP